MKAMTAFPSGSDLRISCEVGEKAGYFMRLALSSNSNAFDGRALYNSGIFLSRFFPVPKRRVR
jgi:hypothetical protein